MDDLCYKRSIGIKVYGFDTNPYEIASDFNALSNATAKGEPHGLKNKYKENQIHILKLLEVEDSWGDTLLSLITDLGGIDALLNKIQALKPKNYFVVVNKSIADFNYQQSNDISIESINLLNKLNCNVSFNFY